MRDLESQLRAWADQAEPVTPGEARDVADETGPIPFRPTGADPRGRYRAWALLAAAIVVLAGVAAFAFRGTDDGGSTPAEPGPGPAPTTPQPAPTDPEDLTSTTSEDPVVEPGGADRPTVLVGYTADNRLVTLDPDTGAELRVLADGFDAPDTQIEGGPYVATDIVVDADRNRILYGTCCEPAVGQIFSVGLEAGDPESFRYADVPALNALTLRLAAVELDENGEQQAVVVRDLAGREVAGGRFPAGSLAVAGLDWKADGKMLAVLTREPATGATQVRLLGIGSERSLDELEVVASGVGADAPGLVRFGRDGVSWVRQDENPNEVGSAVVERLGEDGPIVVERLPQKVLSRFVDGRGVEWRLLADGSVTEDGEVTFTVPGLRTLAG